jgi:hypothetical protein
VAPYANHDLRRQVELASTALEERFIDAAKKDLGATG